MNSVRPITEHKFDAKEFPVVSIFSWVYNHKEYIRESVESILMQKTNFKVEIIIHDDASNDGTREIILEYQNKFPHLFNNILQTQNQWSLGNSVMTPMVEKPQGKYIALTHGDDYWTDPLKLQKQVDFLEKNADYYLVAGNTDILIGDKLVKRNWRLNNKYKTDFTVEDYINKEFFHTTSVCFRKKTISFKGMEDILQGDIFLFLHLSDKNCNKIKFFEETLSIYRIHEGGVTSRAINNNVSQAAGSLIKIYKSFDQESNSTYTHSLNRRINAIRFGEKFINANLMNKILLISMNPYQFVLALIRQVNHIFYKN